MILVTAQAEARVLGTKFTLTTTTNATRLDVSEGRVRLTRTADGARVDVPEGRWTIAATGVEPAARRDLMFRTTWRSTTQVTSMWRIATTPRSVM